MSQLQAAATTPAHSGHVDGLGQSIDSNKRRTVAILFSGGDAPGMNPFLRAFTRLGLNLYKAHVLGVKDGFAGLLRAAQRVLADESASATIQDELHQYCGRAG